MIATAPPDYAAANPLNTGMPTQAAQGPERASDWSAKVRVSATFQSP